MADEDRLPETQRLAYFHDIVGVAVERAVLFRIVCAQIGLASADVVKQDCPVPVFERGSNEPPHVLVTAKTVGEDNRPLSCPVNRYIVAVDYRHSGSSCQAP